MSALLNMQEYASVWRASPPKVPVHLVGQINKARQVCRYFNPREPNGRGCRKGRECLLRLPHDDEREDCHIPNISCWQTEDGACHVSLRPPAPDALHLYLREHNSRVETLNAKNIGPDLISFQLVYMKDPDMKNASAIVTEVRPI